MKEKADVKFQIDFTGNSGMITSQNHLVANLLDSGAKLSNV
jgi:hypothetical protein